MMQEKLLEIYAQSFKDNWELPALSNYISKKTITYGEFAKSIARYHLLFKECGIQKGDKIALLGKNTPEWIQIFFATLINKRNRLVKLSTVCVFFMEDI